MYECSLFLSSNQDLDVWVDYNVSCGVEGRSLGRY